MLSLTRFLMNDPLAFLTDASCRRRIACMPNSKLTRSSSHSTHPTLQNVLHCCLGERLVARTGAVVLIPNASKNGTPHPSGLATVYFLFLGPADNVPSRSTVLRTASPLFLERLADDSAGMNSAGRAAPRTSSIRSIRMFLAAFTSRFHVPPPSRPGACLLLLQWRTLWIEPRFRSTIAPGRVCGHEVL